MSFVHLHVHTQYSLLDGANKIAPLLDHAKASGMEAIAITDHGNMFGAVEFYSQRRTSTGSSRSSDARRISRPASAPIAPRSRGDDFETGGNFHLILLAQNRAGYRNLCKPAHRRLQGRPLLQAAHRQGNPCANATTGLIVLSGCLSSRDRARISSADRFDKAREAAEWYARTFPDRFYLELQDNKLHGAYNEALRELGA